MKCKIPDSFHGRDWAEEFNRVLVSHGEQPYDPGLLETWFSNAIMRGYDEANSIVSHKAIADAISKNGEELSGGGLQCQQDTQSS